MNSHQLTIIRTSERVLAAIWICVMIIPWLIKRKKNQSAIRSVDWVGRRRKPVSARLIKTWDFDQPFSAGAMPVWIHILRGNLALVGPRPLSTDEFVRLSSHHKTRVQVHPGLLSRFQVQAALNMNYSCEKDLALWFGDYTTLKGAAALFTRSVIAALYGSRIQPSNGQSLSLFGLKLQNRPYKSLFKEWNQRMAQREQTVVNFVNPHCINVATENSSYRRALCESDYLLPDGIGIHLASQLTGQRMNTNLNGTDLFPLICRELERQGRRVFFLGGKEDVLADLMAYVELHFPQLVVAGSQNGYFSDHEEPRVMAEINCSKADVVFIAMGVPRQELWIQRATKTIPGCMFFGVGGCFDFYSGHIPRAPLWLRELGLEWSYRLIQEPGRMWRRYLIGNLLFLYRTLTTKHQSVTP